MNAAAAAPPRFLIFYIYLYVVCLIVVFVDVALHNITVFWSQSRS